MWKLSVSEPIGLDIQEKVQSAYQKFLAKESIGFKNLSRFRQAIAECESRANYFSDKEKIVVIGLGGSSLGTKALCEALFPSQWQEKVMFLDNVDVHTMDRFLKDMDSPQSVGWILCSKSGGTIEVQALFDYCHEKVQQSHSFSIIENTLVITEEKESSLFKFAQSHDRPYLTVPLDIGGRFSVFTPVGLMPLTFLGFDKDKALEGFSKALGDKEVVEQLASQLYSSHLREEVNLYTFQYSDRLTHWSLWLQQLWSESLAKATQWDGSPAPVCSTLIPCRGASDQHSVLQQVVEGVEKKFVCFHRVASSEKGDFKIQKSVLGHKIMENKNLGELLKAEAEATEQAVRNSGTRTIVLETLDLDEESMAYLMGLWMLTVGAMGELFNIDAFNQPGVESGKVIARRVLSQSN